SRPVEYIDFSPTSSGDYQTYEFYLQITLDQSANIDTDFLIVESDGSNGVEGSSDGSMYGHACASKCISVAAMDWEEATGADGTFADPETTSVESFSSRGPCIVNDEDRLQPTTCAADRLSTSHLQQG
ncbi:unnamed protein product, partial [Pylaiella littoralis]